MHDKEENTNNVNNISIKLLEHLHTLSEYCNKRMDKCIVLLISLF